MVTNISESYCFLLQGTKSVKTEAGCSETSANIYQITLCRTPQYGNVHSLLNLQVEKWPLIIPLPLHWALSRARYSLLRSPYSYCSARGPGHSPASLRMWPLFPTLHLLLYSEDGGRRSLRNAGKILPENMTSHLRGQQEAAVSSETSVTIYQRTRRHISDNRR
jgi:hypothetical protein